MLRRVRPDVQGETTGDESSSAVDLARLQRWTLMVHGRLSKQSPVCVWLVLQPEDIIIIIRSS
jgi:hypothetical protein